MLHRLSPSPVERFVKLVERDEWRDLKMWCRNRRHARSMH